MHLSTPYILLSMLAVKTCLTEIISDISKHDEVNRLVDAVVNIVKSCYSYRVSAVGLAGDSSDNLIEQLSSRVLLPIALIGNTTRIAENRPASRKSLYRLQLFVITEHFLTELKPIFKRIKDSLWWNHMASFLILDMPDDPMQGCSNAFEILKAAWDMDLLHAKLVCLHPTKGRLIYSFNPFTAHAPGSWQLEHIYRGKKDHPWALFVRSYGNEDDICEELDFEVTNDLGGYEIRATVKNITGSWYTIANATGTDSFGGFSGITARFVFHALNATPMLLQHTSSHGFSHDQRKTSDIAIDMMNGNSDIGLNFRYLSTLDNVTTTYPHWHGGLGALTQFNDYASELDKFRYIVDVKSQYGVYFVVAITLIFFKCFQRHSLTLAVLNTLRIICNSSLPKLPRNHAPRIYLTGLFVFAVIVQVYYQGKMASILTKRVRLPNVNTKQDLIESGHAIYVYKMDARFVNESAFEERYVALNDINCIRHVLRNSSVACLMERQLLVDEALDLKLHVSRDIIAKISYIYVIRPDWPLEQRVNKILMALYESDIIWQICMRDFRNASNILKINESHKARVKFEVITMKDLFFSFVILGIGLACATVAFVVEVVTSFIE